MLKTPTQRALWFGRLLIAVVLFLNVQCALAFLLWPQNYAGSFELSGAVGQAMIRAMGILFLMWNVPYVFALLHPLRNRLSLIEALIMQAIGVIGESLLQFTYPPGHVLLTESTTRFIVFDGLGLVCLLLAFMLTRSARHTTQVEGS